MDKETKTHWREILESNFLGAWDLKGKEPTVTIEKAFREEVFDPQTQGNKTVLVVKFKGAKKDWIVNKTNAKRIEKWHGFAIEDWAGKQVTLIVERVKSFGEVKDAIRVKERFGNKSIAEMAK